MSTGKWALGLDPEMPGALAGKVLIEAKLRALLEALPLAALHHAEDREHVHKLRVASRRLGAALTAFKSVLPSRPLRRLAKEVKSVRRAAGKARDWDVFVKTIQGLDQSPAAAASFVEGWAHAKREDSQKRIEDLRANRISQAAQEVLTAPANGEGSSLKYLADQELPLLLEEVLDGLAAKNSDLEGLHGLRLSGKKLRYSLEIFASAVPRKPLEGCYEAAEDMQESLGRINDFRTALSLVEDLAASAPEGQVPGLALVEDELRRSLVQRVGCFERQRPAWAERLSLEQ